jgi:hypothetical protein
MFVEPPVNDGSNGRGLAQPVPLGPEVTWNVDDATAGVSPVHGVIDAVV